MPPMPPKCPPPPMPPKWPPPPPMPPCPPPPPPPPCAPPPPPPPPPWANAGDASASVTLSAPATRELRTLLFISNPPWLNCGDGYRRNNETTKETPTSQRFQMTKATVSDTEVSFIACRGAVLLRPREYAFF